MTKEYKKYTETPTILWLIGIFAVSTSAAIGAMFLELPYQIIGVLKIITIFSASLGATILLVAIAFPALRDIFMSNRKNKNDIEIP